MLLQSCTDDEQANLPQIIASFTHVIEEDTGVVTFTNTSQNADTYLWEFGDNTASTQINPVKVYDESGTFTVRLIASNVAGATNEVEETIIVTVDNTVAPPPPATFDSGLLTNGDFEIEGANWINGVDDATIAPTVEENGNRFFTATVNNPDPNAPFLVNLSQKLELTSGVTYRLQFDAWADLDRNIIAGIGLSDGDFSNNSEMVAITTTPTTYELVLCANGFGAPNARVLFDLNGEAGTVNLDNVALFIEDDTTNCNDDVDPPPANFDDGLLENGDFENGSEPWFGNALNVQEDGGNSFNFANVETAGNSFDVNLSQVVEIIPEANYILQFVASSDRNRTLIAGIGLNENPFTAATEVVNLTTEPQQFTLNLIASGFGIPNSRVLFDMGADVGVVVIDEVALFLDDTGGGGNNPFDDGLLENGDYQTVDDNDNVTNWIVGVDDNNPAPTVLDGDNRFYSTNITNPDSSAPFAVNVSQKVEIIQGNTYRLQFEAWSDINRGIIAGIGLSGGDFSNNSQVVSIDTTPTMYELVLSADNFGATDARVLFDLNGEAGMVNIDNVALFLEDTGGGGGGGSSGETGGACPDELISAIALPVDFEGCESFLGADNFGNGITTMLTDNPDQSGINPSPFALRIDKVAGADFFAGIQNNFDSTFPDISTRKFTLKVWSSKPNTAFRFEVAQDDPGVGNPQGQFATITEANVWTDVEVVFTNIPAPSSYFRFVVKPDNTQTDDPITADGTYYIDDINLVDQ